MFKKIFEADFYEDLRKIAVLSAILAIIIVMPTFLIPVFASPDPIFSDNFNQNNNNLKNKWRIAAGADNPQNNTNSRVSASDDGLIVRVGSSGKGLLLEGSDGDSFDEGAERDIATKGYAILYVRYSRAIGGFESEQGDEFRAEYSLDGGASVLIETLSANQIHTFTPDTSAFTIPNPERKTKLTLRFYITGTHENNEAGIDDIVITGENPPLFYDGFESGDFTFEGWETEEGPSVVHDDGNDNRMWTDNNGEVHPAHSATDKNGHAANLEGSSGSNPDGAIVKSFSTAGYQNIKARYSRKAQNLESGENLKTYYSVALDEEENPIWTQWESFQNDGYDSVSFVLPSSADNNENFKLRFEINASNGNDDAYIDDVVIWGEPAPMGTITIIKESNPEDWQESWFFIGGNGFGDEFSLSDGGESQNFITYENISTGEYTVAESVPEGWQLTGLECDDGSPADLEAGAANINLSDGERVTCVFTNTKLGKIIVAKETNPASDETEFEFTGELTGILSDGGNMIGMMVPGAYVVTELGKEGWDLLDISCDDENSSGDIEARTAIFNLEAGETIICTFTNMKRAAITVTKILSGREEGGESEEDGFIAGPFTFALLGEILNETLFAVFNGVFENQLDSWTFENLPPNNVYSLAEEIPEGWQGDQQVRCDDESEGGPESIFLNPGQHVTCIFNNTQYGVISGRKFEDMNGNGNDDEGTEPGIAEWLIQLFRFEEESGEWIQIDQTETGDNGNGNYLFSSLMPGTYRVCENLEENWVQTMSGGASCGEDNYGYEINLSAGGISNGNNFGNFKKAAVSGYKWNDLNGDGVWQKEVEIPEPGLSEWEILAAMGEKTYFDATDENGFYSFEFGPEDAGEWVISETIHEAEIGGWLQKYPIEPNTYSFIVNSGNIAENKNFGNQLDETAPVSKFKKDYGHEILDIIDGSLQFSGNSTDYISGVSSAMFTILKIGSSESVANFPSQSFFDVFTEISCAGRQETIDTEIISLNLAGGPFEVFWENIWSPKDAGIYCFKASAADNVGNIENTAIAGPLAFIPSPRISEENENEVSETSLTISWTTDHPATSRVIYDTISHSELGEAPNYGYAFSTDEADKDPMVALHSVTISGLIPGTTYYYRAVSRGSPESVGSEESVTTSTPPPVPSSGSSGSSGGGGGGLVSLGNYTGTAISAPFVPLQETAGASPAAGGASASNSIVAVVQNNIPALNEITSASFPSSASVETSVLGEAVRNEVAVVSETGTQEAVPEESIVQEQAAAATPETFAIPENQPEQTSLLAAIVTLGTGNYWFMILFSSLIFGAAYGIYYFVRKTA